MRVVVVTGGRDVPDNGYAESVLEALGPDAIIVGDCPTGADRYAERWARRNSVPVFPLAALWHVGKTRQESLREGPVRNGRMARLAAWLRDLGCEVVAVAFPTRPSPKGGTWDCVRKLRAVEIRPIVHDRFMSRPAAEGER